MSRKPVLCAVDVWGYPATEDNAGPVEWAWACRCGKHKASYPDEDAARDAANAHIDGTRG